MRLVRALLLALVPLCAQAQTSPVVVGAVLPQTGDLADLASGYRNGLLLWQQEVNAAGGLLGRRVELRLFDDRSEANRDGALYAKLVSEDKADVLLGPFGSAATIAASAVAERDRRVLLDATGATLSVRGSATCFTWPHRTRPMARSCSGCCERPVTRSSMSLRAMIPLRVRWRNASPRARRATG